MIFQKGMLREKKYSNKLAQLSLDVYKVIIDEKNLILTSYDLNLFSPELINLDFESLIEKILSFQFLNLLEYIQLIIVLNKFDLSLIRRFFENLQILNYLLINYDLVNFLLEHKRDTEKEYIRLLINLDKDRLKDLKINIRDLEKTNKVIMSTKYQKPSITKPKDIRKKVSPMTKEIVKKVSLVKPKDMIKKVSPVKPKVSSSKQKVPIIDDKIVTHEKLENRMPSDFICIELVDKIVDELNKDPNDEPSIDYFMNAFKKCGFAGLFDSSQELPPIQFVYNCLHTRPGFQNKKFRMKNLEILDYLHQIPKPDIQAI